MEQQPAVTEPSPDAQDAAAVDLSGITFEMNGCTGEFAKQPDGSYTWIDVQGNNWSGMSVTGNRIGNGTQFFTIETEEDGAVIAVVCMGEWRWVAPSIEDPLAWLRKARDEATEAPELDPPGSLEGVTFFLESRYCPHNGATGSFTMCADGTIDWSESTGDSYSSMTVTGSTISNDKLDFSVAFGGDGRAKLVLFQSIGMQVTPAGLAESGMWPARWVVQDIDESDDATKYTVPKDMPDVCGRWGFCGFDVDSGDSVYGHEEFELEVTSDRTLVLHRQYQAHKVEVLRGVDGSFWGFAFDVPERQPWLCCGSVRKEFKWCHINDASFVQGDTITPSLTEPCFVEENMADSCWLTMVFTRDLMPLHMQLSDFEDPSSLECFKQNGFLVMPEGTVPLDLIEKLLPIALSSGGGPPVTMMQELITKTPIWSKIEELLGSEPQPMICGGHAPTVPMAKKEDAKIVPPSGYSFPLNSHIDFGYEGPYLARHCLLIGVPLTTLEHPHYGNFGVHPGAPDRLAERLIHHAEAAAKEPYSVLTDDSDAPWGMAFWNSLRMLPIEKQRPMMMTVKLGQAYIVHAKMPHFIDENICGPVHRTVAYFAIDRPERSFVLDSLQGRRAQIEHKKQGRESVGTEVEEAFCAMGGVAAAHAQDDMEYDKSHICNVHADFPVFGGSWPPAPPLSDELLQALESVIGSYTVTEPEAHRGTTCTISRNKLNSTVDFTTDGETVENLRMREVSRIEGGWDNFEVSRDDNGAVLSLRGWFGWTWTKDE